MKRLLLALITASGAAFCWAKGDYMTLDTFLNLAFHETEPSPAALWFSGDQREDIKGMVGREPAVLRQRYWGQGRRTAWVLEEIGKERPITIAIAVEAERISRLEILSFRESRGWEVRYPFFTDQFIGISLDDDGQLSEHVDGITGATLSVRAVKKVAKLALYMHGQTPYADE